MFFYWNSVVVILIFCERQEIFRKSLLQNCAENILERRRRERSEPGAASPAA